ncbi:MAG: helix-turn-helix domain-containing protein [Polyangiales bacterium]
MTTEAPAALASLLAAIAAMPNDLANLRDALARLQVDVKALRDAVPPALLTTAEAAKALGVSEATVRRHVRSGELPSVKVGAAVRVDLSRVRPTTAGEVARLALIARDGKPLGGQTSPRSSTVAGRPRTTRKL